MSRNRSAAAAASIPGIAVREPESVGPEFGREPELFERQSAIDPYAAWLALRDDERERQRPAIRWVYRHDASRNDGPSPDAELVGA